MKVKSSSTSAACVLLLSWSGLLLQGCQEPQAESEDCPPEMQATLLGEVDAEGWRDAVEALIDQAPPDSVIMAGFGGLHVSYSAFRTVVEDAGGEVFYEFRTINAVAVEISVRGFAQLYRQDELYSYISRGSPQYSFAGRC